MELSKVQELLAKANFQYYNFGQSELSDAEYDALRQSVEMQLGVVDETVGAPVLDSLSKYDLSDSPMLSLEKVFSVEAINAFYQGELIAMVKCDGLSTRLVYEGGRLIAASTRGNGYEGTDVTAHMIQCANVPKAISYYGRLVVDGEAIIYKQDFDKLNKNHDFANPRNLAAGTLMSLDTSLVRKRKVNFIAWDMVEGPSAESMFFNFRTLQELGFTVVPYVCVAEGSAMDKGAINSHVNNIANEVGIPCDGVVWRIDDIIEGKQRGKTAHHYKNAIAFKWENEIHISYLKDIEWSLGRTGVLTPVAIFDTIDIDGSEVSRASLHNITIMQKLLGKPYIGQPVEVIKSNEIIPQITGTVAKRERGEDFLEIPTTCPICGHELVVKKENDTETLYCVNKECDGQLVNRLIHFCSKKGLNIKGLSEATLTLLVNKGWVNNYADLYKLADYKDQWSNLPNYGQASVIKILMAIEDSKKTTLAQFLASIGIPKLGINLAKIIADHVEDYQDFRNKVDDYYAWDKLDTIGDIICGCINDFNYDEADQVYICLDVTNPKEEVSNELKGKTICITGRLTKFKNRDELSQEIVKRGGRVISAMSSKVNILINNNIESTSVKNKEAKSLGIPIIDEETFCADYLKI